MEQKSFDSEYVRSKSFKKLTHIEFTKGQLPAPPPPSGGQLHCPEKDLFEEASLL